MEKKEKIKKKKLTISISSKKTYNAPQYAHNRQKTSVVIKKSLLVKLGGFRNLPYAADYDLWRAALQFTDCLFLNETLVYYDNSHGFGREYSK